MGPVKPHPTTEVEIYAQTAEKRAGAFFFLPRPESRSLVDLASLAGMDDPFHERLAEESGAEVALGWWAGFSSVARLHEYPDYVALEIFFSLMSFIRLYDGIGRSADLPLDRDPALPVAHTFRDACLRLGAEIGLFTIHPMYAATEWLENEVYPKVRIWDAYALSMDAGLLYANDDVKYNLYAFPDIDARDHLPVERGMLVFGGRGRRRWA